MDPDQEQILIEANREANPEMAPILPPTELGDMLKASQAEQAAQPAPSTPATAPVNNALPVRPGGPPGLPGVPGPF
jgi:hypothetical protein